MGFKFEATVALRQTFMKLPPRSEAVPVPKVQDYLRRTGMPYIIRRVNIRGRRSSSPSASNPTHLRFLSC